jgi:lactate 2-monooxygenase
MTRHGLKPIQNDRTPFPYDPASIDKLCLAGDEKALQQVFLGREWLAEMGSGTFRTWKELEFLKNNWDGPIVLKGIQSVAVIFLLSFFLSAHDRNGSIL